MKVEFEKSHVVLGAFDKTEILESGASQNITLEIDIEDMASLTMRMKKLNDLIR